MKTLATTRHTLLAAPLLVHRLVFSYVGRPWSTSPTPELLTAEVLSGVRDPNPARFFCGFFSCPAPPFLQEPGSG